MGTKDCGRWALYGSSEVAGESATGGPVAGVLVAGSSVLALSTAMEVSWDRFPSCGNYVYMVATIVLCVTSQFKAR